MTSALLPTYARIDLAFEGGEGAWLTTTDGRRYLDFGGGIAVASLGYGHPHLIEALNTQGAKLWHTSNLFEIPQAERLARRLVEVSFADYVFFTNSGAEAVEGAIKTARKYQSASGHREKFRMITFQGAFHGRTLATIAAAGNPRYLEGFGPPVDGFDTVPFDDIEAVKSAMGPQTGAIMIEPIQGEGGIRVAPPRSCGRCASFATGTVFCWCSTRFSPASDARESSSRTSGRVSCPTSWRSPKVSAAAFRLAPC